MLVETKTPRTRHRILSLLKSDGPQDAASLARNLDISAMAVRQHLYELHERELVTYTETPRPVGRPAKLWRLTPAADTFFPNGHGDLVVGLIAAMRRTFGDHGMERLLAARSDDQIAVYKGAMRPHDSLRRRLDTLAKLRTGEGYMATVEPVGRGRYLFIENHCPVCSAATACTGICAAELHVFQETLGREVCIERTDHILAGARRCAYAVEKRN